jgi:hypothetical protein
MVRALGMLGARYPDPLNGYIAFWVDDPSAYDLAFAPGAYTGAQRTPFRSAGARASTSPATAREHALRAVADVT